MKERDHKKHSSPPFLLPLSLLLLSFFFFSPCSSTNSTVQTISIHTDQSTGRFYTEMSIGPPGDKQQFDVAIYTGGSITAIPLASCSGCNTNHGYFNKSTGKDLHKNFDYDFHLDDWYMEGKLFSDEIHFGDMAFKNFSFGLIKKRNNIPMLNKAAGALGLGPLAQSETGNMTVIDALSSLGKIDNSFGICGGRFGGALTLGGSSENLFHGPLEFTPYSLSEHNSAYSIVLNDFLVDGDGVGEISKLSPATVDTAARRILIPKATFRKMETEIINSYCKHDNPPEGLCPDQKGSIFSGLCEDVNRDDLDRYPNFTFVLQNDLHLTLAPRDYMYLQNEDSSTRCFGFAENDKRGTVFGTLMQGAYYTYFDRASRQIGFARRSMNCSDATYVLKYSSGDKQSGEVGERLKHPIKVQVFWANDTRPAEDVKVVFEVAKSSYGTVEHHSQKTDEDGFASTHVYLGSEGKGTVYARVSKALYSPIGFQIESKSSDNLLIASACSTALMVVCCVLMFLLTSKYKKYRLAQEQLAKEGFPGDSSLDEEQSFINYNSSLLSTMAGNRSLNNSDALQEEEEENV